jgi:hypothetical protein
MKKTKNLIIISLISIMLIFNMPLYSNAGQGGGPAPAGGTVTDPSSLEEIITGADNFLSIGESEGPPINQTALTSLSKMISGVLLTIAVGVTLISSVVMGINFLVQSVEEKAKIKESMIPWIIGIVISFGAFGIWEITTKIFMAL